MKKYIGIDLLKTKETRILLLVQGAFGYKGPLVYYTANYMLIVTALKVGIRLT